MFQRDRRKNIFGISEVLAQMLCLPKGIGMKLAQYNRECRVLLRHGL